MTSSRTRVDAVGGERRWDRDAVGGGNGEGSVRPGRWSGDRRSSVLQRGWRTQLVGLGGVVERNADLIKPLLLVGARVLRLDDREHADDRVHRQGGGGTGGGIDVQRETTTLLIGAVIWSYLGIIFEVLTETVAWERWEGTIEYTFMAPLSRAVHLGGMGLFAVLYGVLRTAALFAVSRCSSGWTSPRRTSSSRCWLLAVASVSFVGLGMITAVLPLISPEKGAQLGFIAQGLLLVVSGVYYPVSILPQWMRWISVVSPATYALRGIRGGDAGRRGHRARCG